MALFEYLIKMYSNPGEVVLDPFMGSGTTAVAALATDRKYVGFETNREYYDISIKWSQFQKSVTSEIGFAFAPFSLKPYTNAAIKGGSFKTRPTFERASCINDFKDISE